MLRRILVYSTALLIGGVASLSAQDADLLRGQVLGPDSLPLEGVLVSATALETSVTATKRTGKDGRYTINFINGDGDYMMTFTAIGYKSYGPQELKRELDEAVLVMNVRLGKQAVMLGAIKSSASRAAVNQNDEARISGIGSNDRTVDVSGLPVGQVGDLASLAASLPGVTFIAGVDGAANTFSVLGLDASQNLTTLNGLNFDGSNVPSLATTTARVSTNPFSAAQGGFSGGQLRVTTAAGTNFVKSQERLTGDGKALQFTDATGQASGIQYNQLKYSGAQNGPLAYDHLFYASSWDFSEKQNTLQTLTNTDPLALEKNNIAFDSVAKLLGLLSQYGIPAGNSAIPNNKETQSVSGLQQFDWIPSAGHNYTMTMSGSVNRNLANGLRISQVPTHGGDQTTGQGGIQLRHASSFFDNFLDETNGGVQYTHTTSSPYLAIPSGSVRVTSAFADGAPSGTANLGFGGTPSYPTFNESYTAQITNSTSWVSLNNEHRFQVGENYVYTRFNQSNSSNLLGSYSYNSLSDLQNNLPASFTRTLYPRARDGSNLQQGYFINDAYTPITHLQLQLGLRSDIAQYNQVPTFNPAIDSIFGFNNSHVPNHIYWSPRFGFSYRYGSNTQIGGFAGAARGTASSVSGGFGVFRNLPTAQLVYSAIDNNGLPSGTQQISCVGTAVPSPDWSAWVDNTAPIPTTCANGTAGTVFSNSAPSVVLFDPRNSSQVSNRGQVQWRTPILNNRFVLATTGTYSLNLDQAGVRDLNFSGTPQFLLANEGNRPVYAPVTSIVTATGSIAPEADARTTLFSHVTDDISTLHSITKQLQFQLTPQIFNTTFKYSIAYTYQVIHDYNNGFTTNTDGDPNNLEWARASSDARHQFQFSLGYTFFNAVNFAATARVQSGNPYTPTVSGDINGDGYSDDRAFIYDPKVVKDTALVNGMTNLLNSAQPSVRQCLESQLGAIAGRNTCQAPWYTTMSANINIVSSAFHLPQRATVSFSLTNPLTGLDAAVHGWNNLHGWGGPSTVDPSLLFVRGFNPSTNEFIYQVNQRFGAAAATTTGSRSPFQITMAVTVDVARTQAEQQLNLNLRRGRDTPGLRMDEVALRNQYNNALQNPFALILRQADSLKLTTDQADSIAVLNAQYTRFVDSVWTPIMKYLAALPDDYDIKDAWSHVIGGYDQIIGRLLILGPAAKKIFTTEQLALVPANLSLYFDPAGIKALRPGNTNGQARAAGFGGGGGGGGRGGGN